MDKGFTHRYLPGFRFFILIGLVLIYFSINVSIVIAQNECNEYVIYTIEEDDDLDSIAIFYGDLRFRDSIYEANIDFIDNPNLLIPGQALRIPINIALYKESDLTLSEVLENPSCPLAEGITGEITPLPKNVKEKVMPDPVDEEKLKEFREAFEALMGAQSGTVEADEVYVQAEQQLLLEIDGMVVDETRSKIGRDFYDLFYQAWQAPPDARRFTITISEQPAPGLGTVIFVKANDTETFRYHLQPRYDLIQQAGNHAVRMTYNHLEQNPQDFIIY